MSSFGTLTLREVSDLFEEEIGACSGVVTDLCHGGALLFARSLLPNVDEVRPRDALQGGVALKAKAGRRASVYPYLFRKVCSNGAIIAHAIDGPWVVELDEHPPEEVETQFREAVRQCCEPHVFSSAMDGVRSSVHAEFDVSLMMLSVLSRMPPEIVSQVLENYLEAGDSSRFGFANAVTATARDASDPALRWELEEVGGDIAMGAMPQCPFSSAGVESHGRRQVAV